MPIDVDWAGTDANPYRILIPRADMPIVQASPEIRELSLDQFRQDLRTAEASASGAPWPETHVHVLPFILSGVTYSRLVQILPPYTVEFEAGTYGVIATGADHNLLDVKIANSVSLVGVIGAGRLQIVEVAASPTAQQIRDALGLPSGSGVPPVDEMLQQAHRRLQLDMGVPVVVDEGAAQTITIGSIVIERTVVGSVVTYTRIA